MSSHPSDGAVRRPPDHPLLLRIASPDQAVLGFFFTGLPLSFIVDAQGFRFLLWPAHPGLALGCLLLGFVAWGVFAWTTRALRPAGF